MGPRLQLRNICATYHKVLKRVKKKETIGLLNDKLMNNYKEMISLAESKILKAINYQFNIMVPTD